MIEEIKIALLETTEAPQGDADVADGKYIIRSSGKFKPREYWEMNYRDTTPIEKVNEDLFENFLSSSLDLIFHELIAQTKHKVDSVGIWVNTGGENLEIAMTLESLENMAKYGTTGLVPIYELYKMSILKEDES